MIFILDDDNSRIKKIMKKFGKDNVVYANDPVEAETALRENEKFDIIFLDHDLGGPYTRGPKGDGIDLAKVMAKDKLHTDSFIIVHSLNHRGAQDIKICLSKTHKKMRVVPFYNIAVMHKWDIDNLVEKFTKFTENGS